MKKSGDEIVVQHKDAVEELLEQAAPRPAPPDSDERLVREAVYAEWQAVTGKHRARRRVTQFAIAATVLLAVAISFNAFRVTGVAPVEVASINVSHGSIYLLGQQSQLRELTDVATIVSGQTIETGRASGIGLSWGSGGSLRIDADTRIEFVSPDAVKLHWGQVYFDSQMAAITGSGSTNPDFVIETDHGMVRHLGTQYMTYSDARMLKVSVREGSVEVDDRHTAYEGQQIEIVGRAQPSVTNISGSGAEWAWVESTAPKINVDGMSTFDFLHWVARETGHSVVFESPGARGLAECVDLKGAVNASPREELSLRMLTVDLEARFDSDRGTIIVRSIGPEGCP